MRANNTAAMLPPTHPRPAQLRTQHDLISDALVVSEFGKKDWLRQLKTLKKDYNSEDKERYRPLLNVKRELKEFVDEIEKEEKKNDIAIKKEFNVISQQIHKQRVDVEQAKTLINQARTDPATLDRLHAKVKGIESNLKQFKIKSRAVYEELADEEHLLMTEMEMWEAKFDAYTQEKSAVSDIISSKKSSNPATSNIGARSNSVGNRLYRQNKSAPNNSEMDSQMDDDNQQGADELEKIKLELDKCDLQLQKNGG